MFRSLYQGALTRGTGVGDGGKGVSGRGVDRLAGTAVRSGGIRAACGARDGSGGGGKTVQPQKNAAVNKIMKAAVRARFIQFQYS